MLKVFRDNLKSLAWILWLVIGVFVLFIFADFGALDLGARAARDGDAAATVGDDKVSYSAFQSAYKQSEGQLRQAYGDQFSSEMAKQLGLPLQVLNELVDQRILLAEAKRIGLEVTDRELQKTILALPYLQQDGAFIGEEAYTNLLRQNGLQPEEFESSQRERLLTAKFQSALAQNVYVAPAEVEATYRDEAETAAIRLLRLPASNFAAEVTADDEALAAFFTESREQFRLAERRVVDYLLIEPNKLQANIEVSAEAVNAYYAGHQDDYTSEEQVKARHILLRTGDERDAEQAKSEIVAIRARLDAGEDFAALATELSDDPGSKVRGGDLGFFGRGAMVKSFEEAAFGAELGELVGPVESNFGVHLIQVQAKRPGGLQPLDEVEAGIRTRLALEQARDQAAVNAAELAARLAAETPDAAAIQSFADDDLGVTVVASEPFGRDDNVPGIGRATDFTTQAFDLQAGEVSEAFEVARGWAALVVREIQPPRLPELDEVRAAVTTEYRQQRQLEIAEQRIAAGRAALDDSQDLEQLAAELDVTLEEVAAFGAGGTVGSLGSAGEVTRQALALEAGAVSEPISLDDAVVLFEVTERTHFDDATFVTEQDAVRSRLESERFSELLRSFIAKRREQLGVTYDPRVFEVFAPANNAS